MNGPAGPFDRRPSRAWSIVDSLLVAACPFNEAQPPWSLLERLVDLSIPPPMSGASSDQRATAKPMSAMVLGELEVVPKL